MDTVRHSLTRSRRPPTGRTDRRRRPPRLPHGLGPLIAPGTARPGRKLLPQSLLATRSMSTSTGAATVDELSQIPGAREALARYIGLLQEWDSQSDKGATP